MKKNLIIILSALCMVVLTACSTESSLPPSSLAKCDMQPRIAIITSDKDQVEALLPECLSSRRIPAGDKSVILGSIHGAPVVIANSGKGMVNAAATAQQLIDLFNIKSIIVIGLAVAINPAISPGDIVVPSQWGQNGEMLMAHQRGENYWDINTNTTNFFNDGIHFGMMFPHAVEVCRQGKVQPVYWFPAAPEILKIMPSVSANIHLEAMGNLISSGRQPTVTLGGNGLSSQADIDNPEYRDWLWQNFKADVTDTETAAIAQIAMVHNINFAAIRGIAEVAGSDPNMEAAKIREIARRNVADFTILFLNNYIRDANPFVPQN